MFLENKYSKWYFNIIDNAKKQERKRNKEVYYESHHIIPKCMNGSNTKDNLVLLTAREHFICHWLLIKMLNGKNELIKLCYSFWAMAHIDMKRRGITAKQYEISRNLYIINVSGENHPFYGKCHSEETKMKMRKPKSEETKLKMSKNRPKGPNGKMWFNNGIIEFEELPENVSNDFKKGRLNSKPKQEYIFISPDKQIFNIKGLVDFCLQNDLSKGHMSQVASGKRNHHKGWTSHV